MCRSGLRDAMNAQVAHALELEARDVCRDVCKRVDSESSRFKEACESSRGSGVLSLEEVVREGESNSAWCAKNTVT